MKDRSTIKIDPDAQAELGRRSAGALGPPVSITGPSRPTLRMDRVELEELAQATAPRRPRSVLVRAGIMVGVAVGTALVAAQVPVTPPQAAPSALPTVRSALPLPAPSTRPLELGELEGLDVPAPASRRPPPRRQAPRSWLHTESTPRR